MMTILGSLLGFLGSAAPGIFEIFSRKEQNKKDIEIMKLQAELMREHAEIDLTRFKIRALDDEHARLIEHDIAMQMDHGPLSWLRKSVRPVITYLFFGLFAAVKITTLLHGMENGQDFYTALRLTWDDQTQAIFAAIISFWFGSRALEKNFSRRS